MLVVYFYKNQTKYTKYCNNNVILDAPFFGQILFQDPATNTMEYMIYFHHDVQFIMWLIFILILWFLIRIHLYCNTVNNNTKFDVYKQSTRYARIHNPIQSRHYTKYNKIITIHIPNNPFLGLRLGLLPFLYESLRKRGDYVYKNHNTLLEVIWTVIPTITLLFIIFPSFALLYLMQPLVMSDFSVKVIGSQWYWTYEYELNWDVSHYSKENSSLDFNSLFYINKNKDLFNEMKLTFPTISQNKYINKPAGDTFADQLEFFDPWFSKFSRYLDTFISEDPLSDLSFFNKTAIIESNMVPTSDLQLGEFRLLEVNQKLILPRNTYIRFLVTSTDVLHSWSVPSLGIKIDACPGRLNEIGVYIYRNSIFYGQCSEICGVLHGFMPIVIQTVGLVDYYKYLYLGICNFSSDKLYL